MKRPHLSLILILVTLPFVAMAISRYEPEKLPIKVGVLHSLTGTMAISERPVVDATLLAIEQLNQKGGLQGHKIITVLADGRSDPPTFRKEARRLIVKENVSVIFGCWTSACRKAVKPVFEKYNHLLFYPVQYEGLETSHNIVYTGAPPNQQIIPAVRWSMQQFGKRIYLVGSDYIFPRVANWLIRKLVTIFGGTIVGEQYIDLGSSAVDEVIADIAKTQPDVVLNTINGSSNIDFFHKFYQAGLRAKTTPIMSFSIGESELSQMIKRYGDAVYVQGHYAAWNYFQSLENPQNKLFVSAFKAKYGQNRAISDPMESAWLGVKLWASAVTLSQTSHPQVIADIIIHESIVAPEGIVSIDRATKHSWKTPRIGKILGDGQFEVVWSLEKSLRPEPYPSFITMKQADQYIQQLYRAWNNRWSKPVSKTTTVAKQPQL